jgi:hypothetical protein
MVTMASDVNGAIRHDDYFHTGIVVDDFERAADELAVALGVAWGPGGEMEVPVRLADGAQTISFRYAYTTQGPPYLELVRAVPGTVWTPVAPGQTHHLGYWAHDLAAASRLLAARGLPRVARVGASSEDKPAFAVYHRAQAGVLVELVDAALREAIFPVADVGATR